MLDDKDAIINAFRPIEQLFKAMDMSSNEIDDGLSRSYGEVGIALCTMFRIKIEEIFGPERKMKIDN